MIYLSELVKLLGKDAMLRLDHHRNATALRVLFNYLQGAEQPTVEGAAREVQLPPGGAAFRKLKHQLKIELLNAATALSPIDQSRNRRARRYAYVWKLIAVGKQLRTSLDSEILLAFLEEAFRLAEKGEMIDAAYQAAVMLRRQYVNRRYNRDKYEYFAERVQWYGPRLRSYENAVADFNGVIYLRNTHHPAEQVQANAFRAYERHAHLIERYDLPIISYIVFLIELNIYFAVNDYEGVIRIANKAIAYLEGRPTAQPGMFQAFEANLSLAYAQLNDYERGAAFARGLIASTRPSEYNYSKGYELLLVLSLREVKFQEAYEIYLAGRPETLSPKLPLFTRETFRIIEAYLYLLVQMGQITPRDGEDGFRRFRIRRFVNSFRHAQGEKRHRNIHLLIIEIVYHIVHRKHSKSTYSIEAITKYAGRHLRGKEYRRTRYFLKALAQLSTQRYHREAVARHTRRYIKLMQEHPLNESRLDYYMELVPYDVLWNLILEQLGYKRVRGPGPPPR